MPTQSEEDTAQTIYNLVHILSEKYTEEEGYSIAPKIYFLNDFDVVMRELYGITERTDQT